MPNPHNLKMNRPEIIQFVPYAKENEGLGAAYHNCMKRLEQHEWGLLCDYDMMFLPPDYMRQLEDAILANPEYDCFTVMTNRLSKLRPQAMQLANILPFDNHNIPEHYKVALALQAGKRTEVIDITKKCEEGVPATMGGVAILIKKTTWDMINSMGNPAPLWTFNRHLTIDGKIHKRICTLGLKLGLLKGVYVYHRYRHDGITHVK